MTSPISTSIRTRPTHDLTESPLTIIMVMPSQDFVTGYTGGAIASPFVVNNLTEITASNLAMLGTPATDSTFMAKAAYEYIESGSSVHVYALPFNAASGDDFPTRAPKVVTAINALDTSVVKNVLPRAQADMLLVPRETAFGPTDDVNSILSAIETVCQSSHMGLVALVDVGNATALANTANPAATAPTTADLTTTIKNRYRHLHIYAMSNRGATSNYPGMWGSVIAAGHQARYASIDGVGAYPWNLRDAISGVHSLAPERVFDPGDGSSEAVSLAATDKLSSIIQWEGVDYLWGGESYSAQADPRQNIGNHIVANRMIKRSKRVMAPYLRLRGTGATLDSLQVSVELPLQHLYVPRTVERVTARVPTITSGHVSIILDVKFYDFINSIALTVEVFDNETAT